MTTAAPPRDSVVEARASHRGMVGGIDLGGTKIEACLFDRSLNEVARRRTPTPQNSYDDLLDALVDQYRWLVAEAGTEALPLGIGIPGLTDTATGLSLASNLPTKGKDLRRDLSARVGFAVPVKNDCKCFALSEANGGAGEGYETVFGLILGTGCGGGVCREGRLVEGLNALPGEVGHLGIPVGATSLTDLPALLCKCGRRGCYETLISGPGMSRLALHLKGLTISPDRIAAGAAAGDRNLAEVLTAWADVMGELLRLLQATIDPDCIVLGGGLSRIPDIVAIVSERLPQHLIDGMRVPAIYVARYGDSSGVRGAAMLATLDREPVR